jgi:hypothetical protein
VVHARWGQHATADRLTLEALAVAAPTDAIAMADAWLSRAEALALAGRASESADAAREAGALYAAKGFVNAVRWAERWTDPEPAQAEARPSPALDLSSTRVPAGQHFRRSRAPTTVGA